MLEAEKKLPMTKILKSREFWFLYILAVCYFFYGFYMMSAFKIFGSTKISDDKFLTIIGAVGALINGGMRIVWSSLLDYYPFKRVFGCLILLQLILIATVKWSVSNKWFYLINVSLSMMCEGAMVAVLPTMTL